MKLDLNIDNYSVVDLAKIFNLPENYDIYILEQNELIWYQNILSTEKYDSKSKERLYNFLKKAKNKILNILETQNEPQPKLNATPLLSNDNHMVQITPSDKFFQTDNREFIPGIMNPIKKTTIKKILTIDTRFRDNYYTTQSTNFNFSLPTQFTGVLQMQLISFEIPTTFYAISKQLGNNFFTIVVNGESTVIEILPGNYIENTLINAINYELSLKNEPFSSILFGTDVQNQSYGDHGSRGNTGCWRTFVGVNTNSNIEIKSIELVFQQDIYGTEDRNTPLPLKFGWILGFRNGKYINNLNYISEGLIDTHGPKYLYLVVDDYNNNVNNNHCTAFNSSVLNKNIISRVSLDIPTYNILKTNEISVPREYFGPVNVYTLGIQLLDEYGRVVDLNNMDYSFCLLLTMSYNI